MSIYKEKIKQEQVKLNRHIVHDERSKKFAIEIPKRLKIKTKRHRRYGDSLNQGRVGACTGFAAAHALNCDPYRKDHRGEPVQRNADGLDYYSLATTLDPWRGSYPPADTGSSGLAVAKALKKLGLISSYQWAFGFEHGLAAIMQTPLLQGSYWYSGMSRPAKDGKVAPTGKKLGGHEYLWIGVELRARSDNRSWFLNSWGRGWGKHSYFYMTWKDHKKLLNDKGDLVRLVS